MAHSKRSLIRKLHTFSFKNFHLKDSRKYMYVVLIKKTDDNYSLLILKKINRVRSHQISTLPKAAC